MMGQYNLDQYKKETSQIHAPTDLIRRTKEAVREEEQRIARERMQPNTAEQAKRPYRRVYKWALPAAAIACVILWNIGVMRFGRDISKSQSGSGMDMSSDTAESGNIEMQSTTTGMSGGMSGSADEFTYTESAFDMTAGVMEEAAEEEYEDASFDGGQAADTAVSAENDIYDDVVDEERGGSYIESIYGSALWIDKVDEVPSFYNDSGTKYFDVQGIRIYVGKDQDETWIAYARIEGKKYVICGELTEEDISQEEFAKKAYELLVE